MGECEEEVKCWVTLGRLYETCIPNWWKTAQSNDAGIVSLVVDNKVKIFYLCANFSDNLCFMGS